MSHDPEQVNDILRRAREEASVEALRLRFDEFSKRHGT